MTGGDRVPRGLKPAFLVRLERHGEGRAPSKLMGGTSSVAAEMMAVHERLRQRGSRSIFAARIKSDSVKPFTACVQIVISTLPHARTMSG